MVFWIPQTIGARPRGIGDHGGKRRSNEAPPLFGGPIMLVRTSLKTGQGLGIDPDG